jgi:phosphate-selective porin
VLTGAAGWLALCTGLAAAETDGGKTGGEEGEEVRVAALLDDNTTNDMHDDSTILRNVQVLDDDGLTLFGALRIWVGGALQYDYYNIDDIYRSQSNGESSEGAGFRRLEGIFRSQLLDWGELKLQYDFDDGIFRDVYFRWVSERPNTPVTITIGNQKEPIGLDNLSGNKFEMAQERSAPTHAFGRWRSRGVRLHRAFQLEPEQRKFDIFAEDAAFITTSIGVFTDDIEQSHDTDIAVTARLTGWREKDGVGMHLGFAASYREGDFYRISFRPEVSEADRITLARPDANTQGIVALEGAYNHGRLHLQGEAYYSDYAGRIDGYGGGGYLQAGWFLTRDARQYNPRWGIQAPHRPNGEYSAELFMRLSVTRGDDDESGWNAYRSLTVGANMHYRKLRGSVNLLYGESQEPIGGQEDGVALVARAQYLF